MATLSEKILKQVEFYFGDANLPRDAFLQAEIERNPSGWVPIDTLLRFNRLKQLTTDATVIAEAIKGSSFLEVHDAAAAQPAGEAAPVDALPLSIRRTTPVASRAARPANHVIHVSGFPTEIESPIDAFQETFAPFGAVVLVRPFRDRQAKAFTGQGFVDMASEDAVNAILAAAATEEGVVYNGTKLTIVSRADFHAAQRAAREGSDDAKLPAAKRDGAAADGAAPATKAFAFEKSEGALLRVDGLPATVSHAAIKAYLNEAQDNDNTVRWVEMIAEPSATEPEAATAAAAEPETEGAAAAVAATDANAAVPETEAKETTPETEAKETTPETEAKETTPETEAKDEATKTTAAYVLMQQPESAAGLIEALAAKEGNSVAEGVVTVAAGPDGAACTMCVCPAAEAAGFWERYEAVVISIQAKKHAARHSNRNGGGRGKFQGGKRKQYGGRDGGRDKKVRVEE
ncbi:hypothetical protein CXG81DRAFT_17929 [Caulochytrium protostelioides]|uniref:HTH La-type RNA-binding domain-containing protein n=1 Tax=Caulochytrium protostelioides TaxID=1555241 RepID=A0A4P9XAN6_9FUNG|nr:hypothetical protein CXG81DRAFT_17929 [Caulochytrium protostelioides]|eukprot:RKP02402.1 hypothetical protein CXG81DRAFT_17929 [Caulochytrium protostelioides]